MTKFEYTLAAANGRSRLQHLETQPSASASTCKQRITVVVNSTVLHAKEPEKYIFHIVTDRMKFAAMKMWFIGHPPLDATIHVENFDEFMWLNTSYCPVLRDLRILNNSTSLKSILLLFLLGMKISSTRIPNMKGMVNGAVETCKGSFHQFDGYFNFSDPRISFIFDPKGCGWAFGMNIFNLKQRKKTRTP